MRCSIPEFQRLLSDIREGKIKALVIKDFSRFSRDYIEAGNLLENIEMFDVYRGAQIGEGNKSVAFSLTFRAADRTLTDEEVQKAVEKVMKVCAEKHEAVIRG
mgnify:CR=1 FL=1